MYLYRFQIVLIGVRRTNREFLGALSGIGSRSVTKKYRSGTVFGEF
jgi:hypothetical protein